jgi:hypothetical protein
MPGDLRAASTRLPNSSSGLRWSSWTSAVTRRQRRSQRARLEAALHSSHRQQAVQIRDMQDRYLRRQWNRQA